MNRFSPRIVLLRFTLFIALSCSASGETPLVLDAKTAHQAELQVNPDQTMEIRTTGQDPYIRTLPLPADVDLAKDHVVAFEYFSLTGTDPLQVFLVPPGSEAVSIRSEALGRSEG
ncbi:MAG: hypothetical protein EOP84_31145, partial [Verrucomicrobiaceae bacterium]